MKTRSILTALAAGAVLALASGSVQAAAQPEVQPRAKRGGPRPLGPALEHLLPPRLVEELKLTAEQRARYDQLEAAFKADAEKWRQQHPLTDADLDAIRKARQEGNKAALEKLLPPRKELMQKRKGYVEQFRASLTAEQQQQLDAFLEKGRQRVQQRAGAGGPRGPKPPPVE
jgi:Spy/CpxP family protein refolding chaperone